MMVVGGTTGRGEISKLLEVQFQADKGKPGQGFSRRPCLCSVSPDPGAGIWVRNDVFRPSCMRLCPVLLPTERECEDLFP